MLRLIDYRNLLHRHLVAVAAPLLAAVVGPDGIACAALAAYHLVLAVFERELEEVGLNLRV